MDKKKVKDELGKIQRTLDSLKGYNDRINKLVLILDDCVESAQKELSKSDWVSVEDGLPEYEEEVLVCNKTYPNRMVVTTRCKDVFYDNHNFVIQNMHVTHWKPIDKLED